MLNPNATTFSVEELQAFDNRVRRIIRRVPAVMQNHKLPVLFKGWKLTATGGGLVVLFGILDDDRIMAQTQTTLARYLDADVLHDIATTACDGQYPVVKCNHTGAGYAVVLNAARARRLPAVVEFPGHQRDQLTWGVTYDGRTVTTPWGQHLMLAGMTGSGKSTMLRSLVAQALTEDFQLALCDTGGNTFPMLQGHPALITPLVTDPADAVGFARAVLAEMERRSGLYQRVTGYPDSLEEYNALAAAQGQPSLKRLVVVFEEYTDVVLATGGPRREFSQLATRIALGARKWGLTLVFAGHQFQRETAGLIREQCSTRLCFRVEDHTTASIVVGNAEPTSFRTPGRAFLRGVGRVQTFRLDKQWLVALAQQAGPHLTAEERRLSAGLAAQGGLVSLASLTALGVGLRPAERLVQAWDARGWTAKDPLRKNGRYLTPAVLALLKGESAKTAEGAETAETREMGAETARKQA